MFYSIHQQGMRGQCVTINRAITVGSLDTISHYLIHAFQKHKESPLTSPLEPVALNGTKWQITGLDLVA